MTSSDNSPVPHYPDLLRLDGKGFVVVGAGQGMGRQTSHALVQCGARVVCVDIDADRAADIAEEVGGTPWSGDATARADVERLLDDSVSALGQVYGLVDIIGMAEWGFIVDMDDGVWDRQMAINLRHAYLLGQVFGRHMVASGEGSMVFIASASGMDGAPNHAAYGAAKAGLMAWVKSMAVEMGPHGVRANAVAPGAIATPRIMDMLSDAQRAHSSGNAPIGRMGLPADIAGAALFLSSPLAGYVSGRTLLVDGGVGAKFPYSSLSVLDD